MTKRKKDPEGSPSEQSSEPCKKAKQTKPARAKRLAENKYLDTTTIKCTMGPFCRYKVVRDEIDLWGSVYVGVYARKCSFIRKCSCEKTPKRYHLLLRG